MSFCPKWSKNIKIDMELVNNFPDSRAFLTDPSSSCVFACDNRFNLLPKPHPRVHLTRALMRLYVDGISTPRLKEQGTMLSISHAKQQTGQTASSLPVYSLWVDKSAFLREGNRTIGDCIGRICLLLPSRYGFYLP